MLLVTKVIGETSSEGFLVPTKTVNSRLRRLTKHARRSRNQFSSRVVCALNLDFRAPIVRRLPCISDAILNRCRRARPRFRLNTCARSLVGLSQLPPVGGPTTRVLANPAEAIVRTGKHGHNIE